MRLTRFSHRRIGIAGSPWESRHLAGSVRSRCPSRIGSNPAKMQAGSLLYQEIQFVVRNED